MIKRKLGKVLSLVLAATLTFTSAVPSYAMEGTISDVQKTESTSNSDQIYDDSTLTDSVSGEDLGTDTVIDSDAVDSDIEESELYDESDLEISEESELNGTGEDDMLGAETQPVVVNFHFTNVDFEYQNIYEPYLPEHEEVTKFGGRVTLPVPDPDADLYPPSEGYRFMGFRTTTDGITVESDGLTIVIPSSAMLPGEYQGYIHTIEINLIAEFSNSYDVICDLGGGIYDGKDTYNTSISYLERFDVCLPNPTRSGYDFDYWTTSTGWTVDGNSFMDGGAVQDYVDDGKIKA